MRRNFLEFLKINEVEYKEKEKIAKYSSVKIGGVADVIIFPDSRESLIQSFDACIMQGVAVKTVGKLSNVLPSDNDYRGAIVKTDKMKNIVFNEGTLSIDAGASLPFVAFKCAEIGLSGFEELSGIPGSIGGAILSNAGAFGREISELLVEIVAYHIQSKEITHIKSQDARFGYRDSIFKAGEYIILSAVFRLANTESKIIFDKMASYRDIRIKTQPTNMPSLGSCFKRPSIDISAGKLIDECGLKGFAIGGAEISKKHAGFIVNTSGATSKDYLAVLNYARAKVEERFNILLENEIEIM